MLVGLANDEIGLTSSRNTISRPRAPVSMLPKPKGTHYEETNSIGPSAAPLLLKAFDELLAR